MRVKRWIVLALVGIFVLLAGGAMLRRGEPMDVLWLPYRTLEALGLWDPAQPYGGPTNAVGIGVLTLGLLVSSFALWRLWHSVAGALSPVGESGALVDAVYRNRYLSQGPHVVVLGGGTGLSTMLRGLKQHTSNITAIVTVADDGGSSGKLQKQLNILPPGDIRNCLVALAENEGTMTDLFQHRFRGENAAEGLRDHAFGNLLIAAMTEISGGDFEEAVRRTSRVLNIRGRVLPSTLTHVRLRGEMEDGSLVDGETAIASSPLKVRRILLDPPNAAAPDEVTEAIRTADIVVIGPGSVYTSVVPNLLVQGIPEALVRSRAKKVYICNVMTQPGESDGFAASDHVKAIDAHVSRPVFDYVILNTGSPSQEILAKYRQSGAVVVEPDSDRIKAMGYRPLPGDYISQSDMVRHDPSQLAEAIIRLCGWTPMQRGVSRPVAQ